MSWVMLISGLIRTISGKESGDPRRSPATITRGGNPPGSLFLILVISIHYDGDLSCHYLYQGDHSFLVVVQRGHCLEETVQSQFEF